MCFSASSYHFSPGVLRSNAAFAPGVFCCFQNFQNVARVHTRHLLPKLLISQQAFTCELKEGTNAVILMGVRAPYDRLNGFYDPQTIF